MKTLVFSTDKRLFIPSSEVRRRVINQSQKAGETHLVVFSLRADKLAPEQIAPNCWVYPTRSHARWFYLFDAIRLGRLIIKKKGITEISCQDPFLTAIAAISLKKCFGIPVEIQIHTDIGSSYFGYTFGNKIRKILARWLLPKADKIRVVSQRIADFLKAKSYLPDGKAGNLKATIIVKPIFVDVEKIKNTPITVNLHKKYPQFEKIILMASRLTKEKNIGLAIKAMREIVKQKPKVGLIIVGSGPEEKRLKLQTSVVLEPWVNQETLISYYKTADLFLLTSLYEGYGMTLVESQAAGCKIVSTDVGVAREVGAKIVDQNRNNIARAIVESLR